MNNDSEGAFLNLATADALARLESAVRYGAVGRLADSVTHDMNNMLGVAVAYSELIALDEGLSAESRRMLGEIASGMIRGSTLMNSFTALTRADILRAAAVDAAGLARDALLLTGYVLKRSKVSVETQIPSVDATIVGDGPRLQIALLHLLNNAREFLEALPADQRQVRVTLTFDPSTVTFQVWNSGPPVPEVVRSRMFDPLFTTKPAPHLGLGLTAARAAAELHEGALEYDETSGFSLRISRYPAFAKQLRKESQ